MQILIWVVVEIALFALIWWFLMRKKQRSEGVTPVRRAPSREDSKELRELRQLRSRSLNMPLAERARPSRMEDIIGQEEGIKALRAAMCGPNPQHVIIYGPPGIGKTCAARLVLEEAKQRMDSPFDSLSGFVEVDATCVRFDERAIADPLMGSVHDPIYQGAGAMGAQGVPQPKPGAVTRAHCGVLFLDEIGELHPMQMNKLLKVLEDRRVSFDSAYYSKENNAIPAHIHEIFQNGLPADFRLIGATTRQPEDLPPALRSRCVELFFSPLNQRHLRRIAADAADRLGYDMDEAAVELCASFCASGRDAVNMVQLASGVAYNEGRTLITEPDINWVTQVSHCQRQILPKLEAEPRAGVAVGLAVTGGGCGLALEIECSVERAAPGCGTLEIGGAAEEEELELRQRKLRRKGTARISAENVRSVFSQRFGMNCRDYDIRFNVPGGIPMDGPSAGIALSVALMSAFTHKAPVPLLALTGEITVLGEVRPVGGVREKLEAASQAGARLAVIPQQNWEDTFRELPLRVIPVSDVTEVMRLAFDIPAEVDCDNVIPMIFTA